MAIVGGAEIKLVGSHVGVTLASDGPSQMALADIAFMRAFAHVTDRHARPAITILTPSDAAGAYEMTLTMARSSGAFYLRTVRADLPILYGEDERFPLGGYKVLRNGDGEGRQVVLAASGYMVHSCLKAAAALSEDGPSVTVVDAYCLPMDAASLFALAGRNGVILTVEDTYVGGLGSELAEAAASFRNGPQVRSLVVRRMPKSGRTPDEVLDYVRLGVGDIVAAALSASRDMM